MCKKTAIKLTAIATISLKHRMRCFTPEANIGEAGSQLEIRRRGKYLVGDLSRVEAEK